MARPNIARCIFQDAEALADKTALIEGSRRVAYRELAQTAGRLAAELARRGVRPLDRVAFLCSDSIDYVLLSLAILSLDAAIVPISPGLMSDECAALLDHLDVAHFLADEAVAPDPAAGAPFRTPDLARSFRLVAFPPRRPQPAGYADLRPAFIRFSSASLPARREPARAWCSRMKPSWTGPMPPTKGCGSSQRTSSAGYCR